MEGTLQSHTTPMYASHPTLVTPPWLPAPVNDYDQQCMTVALPQVPAMQMHKCTHRCVCVPIEDTQMTTLDNDEKERFVSEYTHALTHTCTCVNRTLQEISFVTDEVFLYKYLISIYHLYTHWY